MPLVFGFSQGSHISPALTFWRSPYSPQSPSSAIKTSHSLVYVHPSYPPRNCRTRVVTLNTGNHRYGKPARAKIHFNPAAQSRLFTATRIPSIAPEPISDLMMVEISHMIHKELVDQKNTGTSNRPAFHVLAQHFGWQDSFMKGNEASKEKTWRLKSTTRKGRSHRLGKKPRPARNTISEDAVERRPQHSPPPLHHLYFRFSFRIYAGHVCCSRRTSFISFHFVPFEPASCAGCPNASPSPRLSSPRQAPECTWGRGGVTIRFPPRRTGFDSHSHPHPGFSHVEIVPDDAARRRLFSGTSPLPLILFLRCSTLASLRSRRLSKPRC
ncbi:hypothetical protein PR048_016699 [Dryococelus australis]|uniref:Uncharacterized protein n=1 Tax=Dryococelus australis TaxID=614101 RepID=A0ABQ9H7F9_9NEOP|nr:hypothetical protein PR048_016699 [Dryococelus australis]